jgi:hypothetical protein
MSFRGAINAGGRAVPPKLPESLDFDFWEALIFLPEDGFGAGEDVIEVVEGGCRHFEFQMLYICGQKLELSSPIRQVSMGLGGRQLASVVRHHKMSPSLTYAVDAGRKVELNEINRDQQWEAEVKWREKVAG